MLIDREPPPLVGVRCVRKHDKIRESIGTFHRRIALSISWCNAQELTYSHAMRNALDNHAAMSIERLPDTREEASELS